MSHALTLFVKGKRAKPANGRVYSWLSSMSLSQLSMLLILQLSLWWWPFSSLMVDYEANDRKASQNLVVRGRDDRPLARLNQWLVSDHGAVEIHAIRDANDVIKRMDIEGVMSVNDWQSFIDSLQGIASWSLVRMSWKRQEQGWHGHLQLSVAPPKANAPVLDWLPLTTDAPSDLHIPDVRLVTVLSLKDTNKAKIAFLGEHLWVKEGDWVPAMYSTLSKVEARNLTFALSNGQRWTVAKDGVEKIKRAKEKAEGSKHYEDVHR